MKIKKFLTKKMAIKYIYMIRSKILSFHPIYVKYCEKLIISEYKWLKVLESLGII
jgi:hypothetical protein